MLYPEINSYRHKEVIVVEGEVIHVDFNYWVDVNDVYWYSYNDICLLIGINEQYVNKLYHKIPDDKKCTCTDLNQYDNCGEKRPAPVNYITSDEAQNIIQKHTMYISQRNDAIIKIINNLEFVGFSYEVYHDNEELKMRMKKLEDGIKNEDYEEVAYQSYMISKTDSARDVLDKRGVINKEKEEMIDFIRDDIYEYWDCIDEIFIPLTKRPDYEEKQTTIKHKKNSKPTYPEWLGKVVK